MITVDPAEVTQRIISGNYRAADNYGIAWGDPLRTVEDVRAFVLWRHLQENA